MWNVKRKCHSPKGSRHHIIRWWNVNHIIRRLYNNKYIHSSSRQSAAGSHVKRDDDLCCLLHVKVACADSFFLVFPINNMPTIIIIRFELTRPVHLSAFRGTNSKKKKYRGTKTERSPFKKKCPAPWIFFFLKKKERERKLLCLLLDWLTVACGQCRQWTLKIFYFIYIKLSFFFTLCLSVSGGVDDESVYIFVVVSPDTFFSKGGWGDNRTSVARQREWTTRLSCYNSAERIQDTAHMHGRETCGPFKIARHSNSFFVRALVVPSNRGTHVYNHDRDYIKQECLCRAESIYILKIRKNLFCIFHHFLYIMNF